jgi:SAM-dependent methyltransferase
MSVRILGMIGDDVRVYRVCCQEHEMSEQELCERMRGDWNLRAREDAGYYVAFGRRNQTEEEFFETGRDLAVGLTRELPRIKTGSPRAEWRALEIGCGLGRLMRPLSAHFGEIHGVDVSDEMVAQAQEKLRDIPHAHVHVTHGADLTGFGAGTFDLVYSYAVFQHIPSREVVLSYLAEARRVLKDGGVFRFQINGLPETAARYDTWSGVRISAREIRDFAMENDFQLLALEGVLTQYMWVTLHKKPLGWRQAILARPPETSARIRRITNCHRSEPVVPCRGRFATASLWMEELPEDCDLNALEVLFAGKPGTPSYIGPPDHDGVRQVNVSLPSDIESGLHPVQAFWLDRPLAPTATVRVIPPGPLVPRLLSVTDGVDLLSGTRIVSRSIKAGAEEFEGPELFAADLDGIRITGVDSFCIDPIPPRYEFNLTVPECIGAGPHRLDLRIGHRTFPPIAVEIA